MSVLCEICKPISFSCILCDRHIKNILCIGIYKCLIYIVSMLHMVKRKSPARKQRGKEQ